MNSDEQATTFVGIISHGAYIPKMRLQRTAIASAIGWVVPAVKGLAKGQRSVSNWDEDTITIAVEAARNCLQGFDRTSIGNVMLASTTLPFADRSNSGIVVDALNLTEKVSNQDLAGSRRAGTSALIQALKTKLSSQNILLMGADCRETKPGSAQEMLYGHGAAALLLGNDDPIAIPLATAAIHRDLVDQYRPSGDTDFDYALEERWVREEGYMKIVPEVVNSVFSSNDFSADDIDYFILPATVTVTKKVISVCQLNNAELVDPYRNEIGDCGVAQAMLMLSGVLERAKPDQYILMVGFGQGADVIVLKTTESISKNQHGRGITASLNNGRQDDNYIRFLTVRQQINIDYGMRAERDNRTALSAFYRNRHTITGFVGGRCRSCNALQFPFSLVCVKCGEADSQKSESLAELTGTVKSFTEDWLAYSPSPPLIYGNVTFSDGANVMMEFTDFLQGELQVGMKVKMVFRIKDIDKRRNFHRYFWKPAPIAEGEETNG